MITAIIAAAGRGRRFGTDDPKQFHDLLGKPVIFYSLEQFEQCSLIDKIIVAVAEDRLSALATDGRFSAFSKLQKMVPGGATRSESVQRALESVDPNCEIVVIHDAARPLVSVDEIACTVAAAEVHGAACLTVEVTDTIKRMDDGFVLGTVDRSGLRRAVTPQAFSLQILKRAFANANGNEATDECTLVEGIGEPIISVEGSSRNLKITTPDDLIAAEAFLKNS